MQPMIGLPSGLERVRWNESVSSPQPATDAENFRAAAHRGFIAFQHHRAGAFRHHKPSRFFENGFEAACGGSFCVDKRRQQREPHQRFRIDRAVGRHAQRRIALAAADRLDAELDRGRAGGAGRGERDRRALGAEGFGQMARHRAEHETVMVGANRPPPLTRSMSS
jgi:hypothetical protein